MKKISICFPCYNEEANLLPLYDAVQKVLEPYKGKYSFEFIFADNASTDSSRTILRQLAERDKNVKAIFNTRNFGPVASNRNGILSASGDAVITMVCDFQDPPEMLPKFIREWEKGNLVICGQKTTSKESRIKWYARKLYYKIIRDFSEIPQADEVTGFALYDRQVVEDIRRFDNPNIALRYALSYIGYPVVLLPYEQPRRRGGKSSYNIARYLDFAVNSMINTSYFPIRFMTVSGLLLAALTFFLGIVGFVAGCVHGGLLAGGKALLAAALFLFDFIIIFLLGILGEYIAATLKKSNNYPAVFEIERLNFSDEDEKGSEK